MEKYKEIANDPVKLEAALKDAWAKIDTKGAGFVTHEEFRVIPKLWLSLLIYQE